MERKGASKKSLIASIIVIVIVMLLIVSILPTVLRNHASDKSDEFGAYWWKYDLSADVAIVRDYTRFHQGDAISQELASKGITVIEVYESWVLAAMNASQHKSLVQQGYDVETLEDRTLIGRGDYVFDSRKGEPSIPWELRVNLVRHPEYDKFILQFVGPIKEEWKDTVASYGVVLGDYLPHFGFIVTMNQSFERQLKQLYFVQWIGIYEPAYKVQRSVVNSWNAWMDVSIEMFSNSTLDVQRVTNMITAAGGSVRESSASSGTQFIWGSIPHFLVVPLVQDNQVAWLEIHYPAQLF